MVESKRDAVLRMAKEHGQIRPRDLQVASIAPSYLQRLLEQGALIRQGRGIYMLPNAEITEHHSLAEVAKRVPHAVVCLLSALRFHELGTQNPGRIWVGLLKEAKRPRAADLHLEVVRFSLMGMAEGVDRHVVEGVTLKITSPERTIVDCFRYRNKIGLEPALEALRDGLRGRLSLEELRRLGGTFRMTRIMRPYLEALL